MANKKQCDLPSTSALLFLFTLQECLVSFPLLPQYTLLYLSYFQAYLVNKYSGKESRVQMSGCSSPIYPSFFLCSIVPFQAYLVYKYNGKEQPSTTISRGSKYVAAPKSQHSTMMSTGNASANCSSLGEYNHEMHLSPVALHANCSSLGEYSHEMHISPVALHANCSSLG